MTVRIDQMKEALILLVANSPLRRSREAERGLCGPESPLSSQIPDGSRGNIERPSASPPVSMLILLANSPLCRPREAKVGYAAPKAPYPAKFRTDLVGTLSERRIRQQYQQSCHQPPFDEDGPKGGFGARVC